MFTAVLYFTDKAPKKVQFEDRHRAKSFAGHFFHQDDVKRVRVYQSETKKVMLWLSKVNKKVISIQE